MGYLKKRFGEASTMAGMGLIVASLQAYIQGGSIAAFSTALMGLMACALPEGSQK